MSSDVPCPHCGRALAEAAWARRWGACPVCHHRYVSIAAPARGATGDVIAIELPRAFVGRYRLGQLLGQGTMGTVFEASERASGERVAVKFLTWLDDDEVLARFLREGAVLAGLAHPNIVRLRDLSQASGQPYLVMDLAPGGSLRGRLRAGPLSVRDAVSMARGLLSALSMCHGRGIIHRDVKPDNILFAADGRPVLTDMGLAHTLGEDGLRTETGAMMGTPEYMAPEQCRGRRATPSIDLFAVGVVLYEALAGEPPIFGVDLPELIRRRTSSDPPLLSKRAPAVGEELEILVHRALSRCVDDRPRSAEEFAEELSRLPA